MTRPAPHMVKAKLHEIDVRYGRPRKISMAALRAADINRLLMHRYGPVLPDDDAGRDDARIMCHHLALISGEVLPRITSWLARRTPWMPRDEQETLITRVFEKPLRWRADPLGKKFNLLEVDRQHLRITTIGAVDMTKAERDAARKVRKRQAKREKRRKHGVKPRADYEAAAAGHGRPWIAAGVSKATWYRNRKRLQQ